jgi:hypothetical protein
MASLSLPDLGSSDGFSGTGNAGVLPSLSGTGGASPFSTGANAGQSLTSATASSTVAAAQAAAQPLPTNAVQASLYPNKLIAINAANWNAGGRYDFTILVDQGDGTLAPPSQAWLTKYGFNTYLMRLQLPPGSIDINTPFAMEVTATAGGVLEESAGVVFRNITIAGNTGVLPQKTNLGSSGTPAGSLASVAQSIFPSAFSAINQAVSSAQSVVSSVVGPGNNGPANPGPLNQTGYFQFWNLYSFFVAYAEAKKKIGNGSLRLVFNSRKDGIGYLVTPMTFNLSRNKSSPMLYNYQIGLKAWGIQTPAQIPDGLQSYQVPTPANVGAVMAALNTLAAATTAINSASGAIAGLQTDLASIVDVYAQGVIAASAVIGVAASITNFGSVLSSNASNIVANADGTLQNALATVSPAQTQSVVASQGVQTNPTAAVPVVSVETQGPSSQGTQSSLQSAAGPGAPTLPSIGTAAASRSTGSATTPTGETPTAPPNTLNSQVAAFQALISDLTFSAKGLSSLGTLPSQVQAQVDAYNQQALGITSTQIQTLASQLQTIVDNQSANVGLMNPAYALAYGLTPPAATRQANEQDIILQAQILNAKRAWLSLLATGQIFQTRNVDPFAIANENLESDDQLVSPNSSLVVAVNRQDSLETLAQRYLGDANRAREIALLNSLRAPYIDNTGFYVSLIGAAGASVIVGNIVNLELGQPITLSSSGVAATTRMIRAITEINSTEWELNLSGQANLAPFGTGSGQLWARLPGCVGAGSTVLIPDPDDSATSPLRPTPLYDSLSSADKVFGIDLALAPDGQDLAVAPYGDLTYVTGYKNAVQVLQILAETRKGERRMHPGFGINVSTGERNSDLTPESIASDLESQIVADGRFTGADVGVNFNGGSVTSIGVRAQGANGTGLVPVNFQVGDTGKTGTG